MIKSFCIIFVIAIISCDRKLDISGHWVSIPNERGVYNYYRTIDIIDSVLIQDRGSLTQTFVVDTFIVRRLNLASVPVFEGKEKFDNPFGYYPDGSVIIPSFALTLRNDTLVAYGDIFRGKYFIRSEPNFESDLFADLGVQIELPDYKQTLCRDSLGVSKPTFISMGKSRLNKDASSERCFYRTKWNPSVPYA